MGLKGAHVLITGGTRGVGEALVKYFLEQEAEVSCCAPTVTNTEFDEFHNSLPETNTARAVGTALDTLDKEAIEDWVMHSAHRVGRLDVVIAKASDMQMDEETITSDTRCPCTLAADILSLGKLIRAATPYLMDSPHASIIVLGSFIARKLYRAPPALFSLSEASQLQRMHGLIEYLGSKGIRVNAISPGLVPCAGGWREPFSEIIPDNVEERLNDSPLKGLRDVNELVKSVALLFSGPVASVPAGSHCLVDGDIRIVTRI